MADDPNPKEWFKEQDGWDGFWGDAEIGDDEATAPEDFNTWNWKQIRAAILGSAAANTSEWQQAEADSYSLRVADPESLKQAARAFNEACLQLDEAGRQLQTRVRELVGEGGPWQGEASYAFYTKMNEVVQHIYRKVDQLKPVPENLYLGGQQLEWAQREIRKIDSHYANEAAELGAGSTDHDLVSISSKESKHLIPLMTQDMKIVIKQLSDAYRDNIKIPKIADEDITPPLDPSANNEPPPDDGDKDKDKGPDIPDMPDMPEMPDMPDMPDVPEMPEMPEMPEIDQPPGPETPEIDQPPGPEGQQPPGGEDVPPPDGYQGSPPPGGENAPPPGGEDVPPPDGYQGSPPPGGENAPPPDGYQGTPPPGGGNVPPPGGGNVPPPGGGNVPPPAPFPKTPPPGGTGGGNNNRNPIPDYPGTNPPGSGGGDLPGGLETPPPSEYPGGDDMPGGGDMPGGNSTEVPPPSENPDGLPQNDWAANGPGGQSPGQSPGTQDGMGGSRGGMPPMMPPGQQGGGGNGDRSDASGLLGGETRPWEGSDIPTGNPSDMDTPSSSPADWAAYGPGGQSPGQSPGMQDGMGGSRGGMPPMMPPMSPGQQGGGGNGDRSDASGLLGGETEPWQGSDIPIGDPSSVDAPELEAIDWSAPSPGNGSPGQHSATPAWVPAMPPPVVAPMAPPRQDDEQRSKSVREPEQQQQVAAGGESVEPPVLEPQHETPVQQPLAPPPVSPTAPPTRKEPDLPEPIQQEATVDPEPAPDSLPEGHIAVVKPSSNREDTSAWDLDSAGLLPVLLALRGQNGKVDRTEHQPDRVQRETTAWTDPEGPPSGMTTFQRKKASATGEKAVRARELTCSDAPPPPEPERESEPKPDEESAERTPADLLKQDVSAWGGQAPKQPGVLE